MAFDEKLAARIRSHLGKRTGITEKRMFGGIAPTRPWPNRTPGCSI
jgi:hypothetical protein